MLFEHAAAKRAPGIDRGWIGGIDNQRIELSQVDYIPALPSIRALEDLRMTRTYSVDGVTGSIMHRERSGHGQPQLSAVQLSRSVGAQMVADAAGGVQRMAYRDRRVM